MSFAIDTVTDFTDAAPIAGRIGTDESLATEDRQAGTAEASAEVNQADGHATNLDEISVPADAVPPSDPAEVPTEAPAVPAPAVAAEEDDKWWAEIELIGQLSQIERERQEVARRLEDLTEERKNVKKRHDGLVVEMQEVAAEMLSLTADKKLPVKPKAEQPATTDSAAEPEAIEDNAWRATMTADLLKGMKGMGAKKLEAICDLAPTVGHLEDLRADASRQVKPFKDLLPKGCGQGLADAIEDRLVEHVAKSSTPPAHEQVKENANPDPIGEEVNEGFGGLDAVIAEVRQMAKEQGWDLDATEVDQDKDTEATVAGFEAFDEGRPYTDCPPISDYSDAEQRDWLTGWVCGERRKALQDSQPSETDALASL